MNINKVKMYNVFQTYSKYHLQVIYEHVYKP